MFSDSSIYILLLQKKPKKKKHEKGYLKISFLEKSAINGAPFSKFIIHFWEIVSLALSSCYWCDHKEKMVGMLQRKVLDHEKVVSRKWLVELMHGVVL